MTDLNMSNLNETSSAATKAEIRSKYKEMLKEFSAQENLTISHQEESAIIKSTILQANNLFTMVETPQEAVLDARVVRQVTKMCRHFAETLSTNVQSFVLEEFADKICESVGAAAQVKSDQENISPAMMLKNWATFGRDVSDFFLSPPNLSYLLGSIDTNPVEAKMKERARRSAIDKHGDATLATIMTQEVDEDGVVIKREKNNLTEILVQSTNTQLIRRFNNNGREPICFFRFVIHPTSFAKTIENMFHVSFLVKEGRASIVIDEDTKLPKIQSVSTRRTTDGVVEKRQVVMTMSMNEWRSLTRLLKIEQPQICHEDE